MSQLVIQFGIGLESIGHMTLKVLKKISHGLVKIFLQNNYITHQNKFVT